MRTTAFLMWGSVALSVLMVGAFAVYASDSVTIAPAATQEVTADSVCKSVTNNSSTGLSLYVPTAVSGEFASFYNNLPAGVTADDCGADIWASSVCAENPLPMCSGTLAFTQLATYDAGSNHGAIMSCDGTVYGGNWGSMTALSFNGSSFSFIDDSSTALRSLRVTKDDNYVYYTTRTIYGYSFNGSTLTQEGSTGTWMMSIWSDGDYLYAGHEDSNRLRAYTFNGSTFSEAANISIGHQWMMDIHGDGTYIYVASSDSVYSGGNERITALSFNGSTFTILGTHEFNARRVFTDGTYVYAVDDNGTVAAFTFDGSTFTQLATVEAGGTIYYENYGDLWGDGNYLYVASGSAGFKLYTFDGSSFTYKGGYNTSGEAQGIASDGTYVYVADNDNFKAYSAVCN